MLRAVSLPLEVPIPGSTRLQAGLLASPVGSCLPARRACAALPVYRYPVPEGSGSRAHPPLPQGSLLASVAVPGRTGPSCASQGDVRPGPLLGWRDGPSPGGAGRCASFGLVGFAWGFACAGVILVSGRPPAFTGRWLAPGATPLARGDRHPTTPLGSCPAGSFRFCLLFCAVTWAPPSLGLFRAVRPACPLRTSFCRRCTRTIVSRPA